MDHPTDGGREKDPRPDREDSGGDDDPGVRRLLEPFTGDRGRDLRRAVTGGLVAAVVAALGVGTTGIASGAEARSLLAGMVPTIRFLTSAVITASATIMALMLTILSLSAESDWSFRGHHYIRIRRIGIWSSAAIILGVVLLLFLSIPMEESDVLRNWYEAAYYGVVLASSALGGLLVAVVLLLQRTIAGLVKAAHPDQHSHLTLEQEDAQA